MATQSTSAPFIAIIPAAGIGSRMQAKQAKQYLKIGAQTILERTLTIFCEHPEIHAVYVALHPNDPSFDTLKIAAHPKIQRVAGGAERVNSVLNCLENIAADDAVVLVHDAARPCLQTPDVDRLLAYYREHESPAILAKPASDTIKVSQAQQPRVASTLDRRTIWQAQTPQIAALTALKQSITEGLAQDLMLTDEASALEAAGYPVALIEGPSYNIKITHPEDLALAEFYLTQQGLMTQ